MAEPFDRKTLDKLVPFFQSPARPNILGTSAGQAALEQERKGLASFLGATDYSKQLQEAQDMGKLQLALALAQRGFAAAGATPKRGEAPLSTISRELFSPIAGDAGAVASQMMQQRRAIENARAQEERQLKLTALQNMQRRQDLEFQDSSRALEQARAFAITSQKKGDTVSNDYLVDGKNVPLIVRKDYTGKVEGFYNLDGRKIENARVKIYRKPDAASKPITSWAKDVQVKGPKGNWIDAPDALRIADATGENSRVVIGSTVLDFNEKSPTYNARIVNKKSDQSAFYKPSTRTVYLNESAIDLFGLDRKLIGQQAIFREYLVKPEMRGPNSRSLKELSIAGRTYVLNEHSGYSPETGNITIERGPNEIPVTFEATELFREEDPKAFTSAGELTVPSNATALKQIQSIKGLEGVKAGDKIKVERNAQGKIQVRRGQSIVPLTDDQNALFQTQPLSPVQQVEAGQVLETRETFVNKSNKTIRVGGQTVGPGQLGSFSKTDLNSASFLNNSNAFQKVGDTSADTVTYMYVGDTSGTVTNSGVNVEYAPGDEARFNPQEFALLPEEVKKNFTTDTAIRSQTVKKNFFNSLAKTVQKENPGLSDRNLTKTELQGLLASFPAGMRSGGKNLYTEIFNILKLGRTANPNSSLTSAASGAINSAQSYAESVANDLKKAEERYNKFVERDLISVPWNQLSFERKRAFADLPKVLNPRNVTALWQKSEDRLENDKKSLTAMSPSDATAFNAATELLILAKYLRDNNEVLEKTGRFTGFLGQIGVNTFGDLDPLTSGGSKKLMTVINRMKASYGILSDEGGRDSVFKQKLQENLVPAFTSTENINRANLNTIINRLETNVRSVFSPEIKSRIVVPKSFEIGAKEAGVDDVSVDQKRYRWLDPNEETFAPVTRERTLGFLDVVPVDIQFVQDLRVGRLLPPAPNNQNVRYVKLENLTNGEVLIQRARRDGRPDPSAPRLILGADMSTRRQ